MTENEEMGDLERLQEDLRGLAAGPSPPEGAEARLVAELRARDLLSSRQRLLRRSLVTAAGAAFLFVGGVFAGLSWRGADPVEPPAARYALFLLGGVDAGPDEAALVDEYRSWASELARTGQLVAGEKLDPAAWLVEGNEVLMAPAAHRAAPLSGFFLLTTNDPERALAIARSCPHLRHGGRVLLRPIEPT